MENVIGQLVAKDYRTAAVFEKYGIDFCCKGNRTIDDVCNQKNINKENLTKDLELLNDESQANSNDYNEWPLDLLASYIVQKHHRYVEKQIPVLQTYLKKIAGVHGREHPELFEIAELFNKTAAELTAHMKKEELILFPQIQKLVCTQNDGVENNTIPFGTFKNPISVMMDEHTSEGERFQKIKELSNNYAVPAGACNTYRVAFALLNEFENDLHLHIHLENNILFPKAIAIENQKK